MGKRKRLAEDAGRQHGGLAVSTNTPRHSGSVKSATQASARNGHSKDFFGSEWMNAVDRHRKELSRPRRDERNGRGKNSTKRKSQQQPHQTTASFDAPAQQGDSSDRHPQAFVYNTDHLIAPGSTRSQRRRDKRKLIRKDVLPKRRDPQPAPHMRQEKFCGWSQAAPPPVPWKDKPIGRKALAHQLATTTLMKPPPRRWEGLEDEQAATPWQRSATNCEKDVLAEAPFADGLEAKSKVSGAFSRPAPPDIHTRDPHTSHRSQEDTSLRDSLQPSRPFGLGPTPKTKRHSFGNKANSVPTYMVAGDIAERFKRFSAAANGRSVDDSSDESSESSSDDVEDEQPVTSVSSNDKAGLIASAPDSNIGPVEDPRHVSEAPSEILNSLPLRGVKSMSELSAEANRQKQRQSRDTHLRQPSTQGSKRHASEMDETASQVSFPMRSRSAVSTPPSDADLFDAEQAVQDIIQSEMALTRALPAGKNEPTRSTQREVEDGILTQDSSDLRIVQADAKSQPSPLAKRIDSAMPDVVGDTIIVQSLQLAAQDGVEQQGLAASATGDATGNKGRHSYQSEAKANESDIIDSRSTSPLSELADSPPAPSGPQLRSAHTAKPNVGSVDTQRPQIAGQDDAEHNQATEEPAASKKKRKMTGLTSKHFSTPRVKTKSSENLEAKTAGQRTPEMSAEGHDSSASNVRKQTVGKSLSTVEAVLAETRRLLGEPSQNADQEDSAQRKSRTPRSGRTTDLDDSNIIEYRTRRVPRVEDQAQPNDKRSATGGEKSSKRKRSRQSEPSPARATDGEVLGAQDEDDEEAETRPRKRARRSGGPITDFSTDNILEGRSRRSMTAVPDPNARELSNENDLPEKEDTAGSQAESHHSGASKPKTHPRRSGGNVTDVDSSNILPTSSRGHVRATDVKPKTDEDHGNAEIATSEVADEPEPRKSRAKRKSTGKRSIYFTPPKPPLDPSIDRVDHYNTTGKKKRVPAGVSVAPVPSIHSDRFGIIQEKLWREPFWLLIAVTFLNKTAGRAAAPTFWKLKEQYQTAEALAAADQGELHDMIHHLGLQTQRSKRLIAMSKAWVEAEPRAGLRWRVLHYPEKGDGKGYKAGEPIEEDAADIVGAIEIGRIPGCGPYAMDSWRIFCRDVLRGVAEDYNGNNAEAEGFVPEWQKVLPGDKELRACLRWMWLREGWIWDHETGSKRRASEEEMEMAVRGEMEVPDEQEKVFAERAAAKGGALVAESEQAVSPEKGTRSKKRPATPESDDVGGEMSDNIVVGSTAKRRRSGRRRTA